MWVRRGMERLKGTSLK
jgi:hypothetical protein